MSDSQLQRKGGEEVEKLGNPPNIWLDTNNIQVDDFKPFSCHVINMGQSFSKHSCLDRDVCMMIEQLLLGQSV